LECKVWKGWVYTPSQQLRNCLQSPDMKYLSTLSFYLGLASVLASIAIWYFSGGKETDFQVRTHGELFGIFVGLWAPTFLILSHCIARYSEKK